MVIKGDFFAEKREWSKLKDRILNNYLAPYLAKITTSGRPTRIVDCFAGKGKFGDGQPGSPLIITRHVANMLARNPALDVKAIFIEQKHAAELKANIVTAKNCEVLEGEYEQCILQFLSRPVEQNRNYFFYVDPYGIKSLDFAHFARLKKIGFQSLEMLINLNTTGFLREGCRLLNLVCEVPDGDDELDYETDARNTPGRMDEIAGGDYWRSILNAFQARAISFHEAEKQFITGYTGHLGLQFRYVVDIPIKARSNHMPKYRLVFATDHHDGLFLMADQMHAAWQTLLAQERGGQLYLFDDTALDAMQGPTILEKITAELRSPLEFQKLLARLIRKYGIAHTTREYSVAIKEKEGVLFKLVRNPAQTSTGRQSRSMDYNKIMITVCAIPQKQQQLLLQ